MAVKVLCPHCQEYEIEPPAAVVAPIDVFILIHVASNAILGVYRHRESAAWEAARIAGTRIETRRVG